MEKVGIALNSSRDLRDKIKSIGNMEFQPRPKNISEAMMKIFHSISKKINSDE